MAPQTTKIIRYSTQGFKPQYQFHHLKHIDYHINNFNINDFPEHLRYIIQHNHEDHLQFYKEPYSILEVLIVFFVKRKMFFMLFLDYIS